MTLDGKIKFKVKDNEAKFLKKVNKEKNNKIQNYIIKKK